VTQSKTEKERQLADGREGGWGGRGAESYDRKKAWSSIDHSILSGIMHQEGVGCIQELGSEEGHYAGLEEGQYELDYAALVGPGSVSPATEEFCLPLSPLEEGSPCPDLDQDPGRLTDR
jgi:hypothetical protein